MVTSLFSEEKMNLFPEGPQKTATSPKPSREVRKMSEEYLLVLSVTNFSGVPLRPAVTKSRVSLMIGQYPVLPGGRLRLVPGDPDLCLRMRKMVTYKMAT
ncbi:hypothetical protein CRG98_001526 [Punica granatum]|uniref:Uncharacterized protein n=1 Tax=Punica granatum TaxID=22663 RepID=A0A2I0LCY9_PUNGR|nr:hypothetical protein CRG98_001526 [Punica granatum]